MEEIKDLSRPSIFEYDNYRLFLRDLYTHLKAQRSQFSFRYFSQRAGFTSPNFLKLVMENKRNLSKDSIERFSKALKLTAVESDFFNRLVHFNQAQTDSERSHWSLELLRCRGFQKIHPLRQAEYSYYANWYYIPIREMVSLKSFSSDLNWIAEQFTPALSHDDVKQALDHLEKLQMIKQDEKGVWCQTQKSITTGNEVHNSFVKKYHQEMLVKASESIESYSRDLREISAVCVPVSKNKASEIKQLIQNFRKELMVLVEGDDEADRVYQFNIQWFPLAMNKKRSL